MWKKKNNPYQKSFVKLLISRMVHKNTWPVLRKRYARYAGLATRLLRKWNLVVNGTEGNTFTYRSRSCVNTCVYIECSFKKLLWQCKHSILAQFSVHSLNLKHACMLHRQRYSYKETYERVLNEFEIRM